MSEIRLLTKNLQEIYSLSEVYEDYHRPTKVLPTLVPSLWGHRVYATTSCWGKLLKAIYVIFGSAMRHRKLREALRKTHEIFHRHLSNIDEAVQKYKKYIKLATADKPVSKKESSEARVAITEWNDTIGPFLRFLGVNGKLVVNEIFRRSLDMKAGSTTPFFVYQQNFIGDYTELQRVIDLEGLSGKALPFSALAFTSYYKTLSSQQQTDFEEFAKKMEALYQNKEITVDYLHLALKTILDSVSHNNKSIASIEMSLMDCGCRIFEDEDPDHMKWRRSLKPGDVVTCNGNQITLGRRIGAKPHGKKDRYILFEDANSPVQLVRIASNQAMLAISKARNENYSGQIRAVRFWDIDAVGKVALVDRLSLHLRNIVWSSRKGVFAAADAKKYNWLAPMLKTMVDNRESPCEEFSTEKLMFDAPGRLWYIGDISRGDYNVNVLTKLARDLSNKNLTIFRKLMEDSGLSRHEYTSFYEEIVEKAANNGTNDVEKIAAACNITELSIIEHAQELYNAVIELQDSCCKRLRAYSRAAVSGRIMELYKETLGSGILWHTLENSVVKSFRG